MLTNIEEIKNKRSAEYAGRDSVFSGSGEFSSRQRHFKAGFDEAMGLQLPVRFAKYLSDNFSLCLPVGWIKISSGEWLDEEEIYKDWITNIYTQ